MNLNNKNNNVNRLLCGSRLKIDSSDDFVVICVSNIAKSALSACLVRCFRKRFWSYVQMLKNMFLMNITYTSSLFHIICLLQNHVDEIWSLCAYLFFNKKRRIYQTLQRNDKIFTFSIKRKRMKQTLLDMIYDSVGAKNESKLSYYC